MKLVGIILLIFLYIAPTVSCDRKKVSEKPASQAGNTDRNDDFIYTINNCTYTELGKACKEGDLKRVEELVREGACRNRCASDEIAEYPALYIAISNGKEKIVKYLIPLEENLNQPQDKHGNTYLTIACKYADKNLSVRMVKKLLDAGARVNRSDNPKKEHLSHALHEALAGSNLELAKLFVERGADIHAHNRYGHSLLDMLDQEGVDSSTKAYIGELFASDHPNKDFASARYAGIYTFGTGNVEKPNGKVYIYPATETSVLFYIYINKGAPSHNMGMLSGSLEVIRGRGIFKENFGYSQNDCNVTFSFEEGAVHISEKEEMCDCGFGNGVYLNQTFTQKTKEIPLYYTDVTGKIIPFHTLVARLHEEEL